MALLPLGGKSTSWSPKRQRPKVAAAAVRHICLWWPNSSGIFQKKNEIKKYGTVPEQDRSILLGALLVKNPSACPIHRTELTSRAKATRLALEGCACVSIHGKRCHCSCCSRGRGRILRAIQYRDLSARPGLCGRGNRQW